MCRRNLDKAPSCHGTTRVLGYSGVPRLEVSKVREHEMRQRIAQYLRTAAQGALVPALGMCLATACDKERGIVVPVYGAPIQCSPHGRVLDEFGQGVAASVKIVRTGEMTYTGQDGFFQFTLPGFKGDAALHVDAENYFSKEVPLSLGSLGCGEVTVTLRRRPSVPTVRLDHGRIGLLRPIAFWIYDNEPTSQFVDDARGILNEVVELMLAHPEIHHLSVQVSTDRRLKPDRAQAISEAQADAVFEYLVKQGIDRTRLQAIALGRGKPGSSKSKPNRGTVDFIILD
jgi:hypothetical protein